MMVPSFLRFARDERGASMVEFALVLPILCIFIFGAIDFGRALKVYNNLSAAARDGARYGASQSSPLDKLAEISARTQAAYQDAMGVALPANKIAVEFGPPVPPPADGPEWVKVKINNFEYDPWTPIPGGQALTFNIRARFRWEYRYTP